MKYAESIIDVMGKTPLVRLKRVGPEGGPLILGKVEYLNPGGSVKDRIARRMIEAAEADGRLKPGGTIIEGTSGNTGTGLALVALEKGYRCIFVCPDAVSSDKVRVLRAYGAEVVVVPSAVAPEDPRSYYSVSDRLTAENPGAWKPDQYSNPEAPASHYATTGPEIWADTEGRITHLVLGIGSGGTITGAGRYLKDVSADRPGGPVQVIGVDPEGSVFSGNAFRPYLVEGVGEDFFPEVYDPTVPDEIVTVSDADAFRMTRRLAREEGLLVGGSSGLAVVAALRVAQRLGPDDVVVVLLPDGGRGYLSKIYDDDWMASHGFLRTDAGSGGRSAGDVLRAKGGDLPALVHTHPTETVGAALEILREYRVEQMPVLVAEPPAMALEVVGSVSERSLREAVSTAGASRSDPVERHLSESLPLVGVGESLEVARKAVDRAHTVMVMQDGKPIGILTRSDFSSDPS